MSTTGWSTTTKENTNFARLCKLLIDGGTHVLRKIFDAKHPPHDLKKHLMDRRNHRILKNLKTTNILRGDQWSKLYPSVDAPTSASFDITLLSLLLRNICNLPTPANGWSNEPAATSISQEDDIVRVKLYRNKLSHISEPALSDADFNKYWNDIETVLLRLGADMAAIDSLRTQSMDPEDEQYYNEFLKEWAENEERLLQAILGLEEKMENILKTSPSRPVRPTSEDMESYFQNLKKAIIKQTELLPKGKIAETIKTDDIFTNLVIHHGKKRCRAQIQRPQEYHPDRKTLTEMKQCSEIFVDEDEKDTTVKRILLSGEPGVGKTLFSQKLLRDLSTNSISIPEIKFIYLITFRQLNNFSNEETLNLRELLNLCPLLNDKTMIDENVMDYILQHPEQLLIVLDGFDEYKDSNKMLGDFESQFPNDSKSRIPVAALLSKLFRKKILADAVIMVTSRPSEANALDKEIHPDHYVEITGFSESEVIAYVKKYFSTKPEEVKNMALSKVKESAHYISFGRVPFRCLLMCVFIEWKIKKHDNSCPLTLTEFYFQVIQCIEEYYNKAILSLDDKAASLAVNKTLDNFSKLAALLAEQHRFSFTLQDLEHLKLSDNELLYIKSSNLIFCYPVSSNNLPFQKPTCEYSFTNFTIQEFFVARYLMKKGVMAAQESTEMVYIFMSGLLGLNVNNELMLELLECLGKHIKDEGRLRLVSLRCLHEFGQDKRLTIQELNANRDNRYWNSDGRIVLRNVTDTDCDIIAVLLESTATSISSPPHVLSIFLSSFTSSGLRRLLSSLIHSNCSISTLILSYCELNDECATVIAKVLPKTKLTKLGLSGNRMTDIGVDYIINHISSNLNFLDLSGNLISDEYAERTDAFFKENYPGLTYRNFLASKVPSRLPPEIIAQGPVAERSYRKALEHGEVKIYRGCVKIIGQDRAGKTSLKRSLCGLSFNPEEESTVGVEVSLCTPVTMNDVESWQIKETDEGIIVDDDVARTMAIDIEMQGDLTGDTEDDNDGDDDDHVPLNPATEVTSEPLKQADEPAYLPQQVSSEKVPVPKEVQQSPERKIDETIKDSREIENHEATTKKILESSSKQNLQVPEGIKKSLIKYLEEKKIDDTIKDTEVEISIWDFAGQHLYYASHPVFMSHRAIYILVYNLGKDLDDKAEPRARQGTREIVLDNASNETNLDNLLSWLVSVHCLCQPHTDSRVETEDYICPPVIIVGTHADELTGSEDERERLVEIQRRKIDSAIEKCEFQNHVMKPFFVVDNNKSADDDGIKSLHSKIKELLNMEPYFPEPVPIRWFHFEKALQSLLQEKKTSFLSVKELSEIAHKVCSIDQTEIGTMLNFYHRLGIIIKYGGTVVLDAKWLINLFKSLITIEPDEVKAKHRQFWKELAETGRLHTDLINHVFKEQLKYAPLEAKDDAMKDILDMMEYFGLISKIIPSDHKKEYCHLVPSHLTSSPEDELKKCHPSSGEPCPLYVRFLDGFIPHGLYFQMICRWCSIYGSQKRPNLFPREPKLFRNAAKFVLDNNSKLIMTVVCCKNTIKVCLHSNRENKTGVDFKAVEIRNLIQESLDSLTEKCPWYQSLQYELCIRCPLCAVNASGKVEGHLFRDDNCLHPTTDDEEFYCEEKDEWPEVSGLHHWFSRPTIEPSDRQSVRGDVRVSNGLFVVINIAKFDQRLKKLSDRIGSEYDEKAMVELFGDYFGFEVVNLSNKDGAVEIKQELRNISFDKKYGDKDCFVLCIMSHGDEGVFYTSDCQTIECKEIVSYFENGMCKSFRGKPKLFIFQACRGGDVDRGVAVTDFPADPRGNKESQESCAIHQQSPEREHVISCKTNILQAFCCSKGYISCRDLNSGTYYIQSLVRIFRRFASTEDVVRMLERVNKDVSSKQMELTDEPRVKQGPTFSSSLGDVVYFCTK